MRILRRGEVVLAGDIKRFAFSPRGVIGVHEVVHHARVLRIRLIDAHQQYCGPVGVFTRTFAGWRGGQMRQRVESGGIGVVIAIPQCAMTHVGSVRTMLSNAVRACG